MSTLLHIDSSGKGSQSVTETLTKYFAEKWKEQNRDGKVIHRHLLQSELPFIQPELYAAYHTAPDAMTEKQRALISSSDKYVDELFAADTYVFGVPMYNFSVPAAFKAYIDLIVRIGRTCVFENGAPKGVLKNKKGYVVIASGGDYSAEPYKSVDFVTPFVRSILGFIGITDLTFIYAHGMDAETINATSATAKNKIDELLKQMASV